MQLQQRWLRRWAAASLGLAAAVGVTGAPAPAQAQSVAEDLISIMEANGQLTPEQARTLREKAVIEQAELTRRIRDDNVLDASMWGTTVGLNYHLAPKYRHVVRANWVHLEHETDVVTAGRDDDLDQDFFLVQ